MCFALNPVSSQTTHTLQISFDTFSFDLIDGLLHSTKTQTVRHCRFFVPTEFKFTTGRGARILEVSLLYLRGHVFFIPTWLKYIMYSLQVEFEVISCVTPCNHNKAPRTHTISVTSCECASTLQGLTCRKSNNI